MQLHDIRIPLPEGADLDPAEQEELTAIFQALAAVPLDRIQRWKVVLDHLRAAGWNVEHGLQWHVVARRGREIEEACGITRNEAFDKLDRVTRVERVSGTP
jgi:hypothetical protein